MKILMCPPQFFDVNYKINPWMNRMRPVNKVLANTQWKNLVKTIQSIGAEVVVIQPHNELPDMVFTANAGLLKDNEVILAQFKYPQRQPESALFKKWFEDQQYTVITPPIYFEGAGDALFAGEHLFFGHGFRSDPTFLEWLKTIWNIKITHLELVDPNFYHLDTCFCPLDANTALWYPEAFSPKSQKLLEQSLQLISTSKQDALAFACNAVVMDQNVILATNCHATEKKLNNQGYTTHACDTSEFLLSGGSCKCLTLAI